MIARVWHGRTPAAKADSYLEFLRERAFPDYRSTPGLVAVHLMRRIEGEVAHFVFITHWESLAAIRGFAGDDVERAKYYPEDLEYLLELEPNVQHYELFD